MKKSSILLAVGFIVLVGIGASNAAADDHRMEKQFGLTLGLISDPFVSLVSINANYNLTDYLRLTGGVGYLYGESYTSTSATRFDSGASFGFGMKALVPHWEFSPVLGLNVSDGFLDLGPNGSFFSVSNPDGNGVFNLFIIYGNFGFDYQAKDGFDLGFGFNVPIVSAPSFSTVLIIPGLNIGKFF